MTTPLISIITPTFNCGIKVAATAASVFSQEKDLYEFLVVDGGSTDGTLTHLRPQGSALRWISEPDAGIYDAMNKGILLSKGRFLYFLGAGDCLRPGALRTVAEHLSTSPSALQFVYGDVNWPEKGGRYGGVFGPLELGRRNICHQAIFYSRGIFDLLGSYDLRYKTCADYAMNIRCFGEAAIRKLHLDLIVADYEDGGASDEMDRAFQADRFSLTRRHLGLRAGIQAAYLYSSYFHWARLMHIQAKQPLRTLPNRVLRKAHRLLSRTT